MTYFRKYGVALIALLLLALPALAATPSLPVTHHTGLVIGLGLALGLVGTVTNAYLTPGTGTTAPTTSQAAGVMAQIAQVGLGDADTTATITHNWNIAAAALLEGFPMLSYYGTGPGVAGTAILTVVRNANTLTINKPSGTGSGGTWTFCLMRPPSSFVQNSGN